MVASCLPGLARPARGNNVPSVWSTLEHLKWHQSFFVFVQVELCVCVCVHSFSALSLFWICSFRFLFFSRVHARLVPAALLGMIVEREGWLVWHTQSSLSSYC